MAAQLPLVFEDWFVDGRAKSFQACQMEVYQQPATSKPSQVYFIENHWKKE